MEKGDAQVRVAELSSADSLVLVILLWRYKGLAWPEKMNEEKKEFFICSKWMDEAAVNRGTDNAISQRGGHLPATYIHTCFHLVCGCAF